MKTAEFQRHLKMNSKPIIVDLWAPWCRPCQAMVPAFEQVREKYAAQVDVVKINADDSREVLQSLGVMSIPTVIGFAGGEEIVRRTGMQTAGMLDVLFDATLHRQKPAVMPIAPASRLLRSVLGLGVAAVGWFGFHSYVLMAIGAIVLFSAFYDRCPVYRAVAARVRALFQHSKEKDPSA